MTLNDLKIVVDAALRSGCNPDDVVKVCIGRSTWVVVANAIIDERLLLLPDGWENREV
jgi:hypothetical protein